MPAGGEFSIIVTSAEQLVRLDAVIAARIAELSRSHATTLIRDGHVTVNGHRHKPGYRVKPGDTIYGRIPPPDPLALVASPISLDIIHEDDAIIVVNKPAGLVVHPAAGHASDTLVNALLHHCPDLASSGNGIGGVARPGIVHRLDKDTSGVLVVAKNDQSQKALSLQFKDRLVSKTYLAVVRDDMKGGSGSIDLPVGRHPLDRKKMSVSSRKGRPATTLWRVKERFKSACLLEIDLKTGRTHQIRVHCAALGHPVLGDQVYGRLKAVRHLGQSDPQLFQVLSAVKRQLLHAARLSFFHPVGGQRVTFVADLPQDLLDVLEALRALNQGVRRTSDR